MLASLPGWPSWPPAERPFVVGPSGAFVLLPGTTTSPAHGRGPRPAQPTRAALGDHLSWVPFLDVAVLPSGADQAEAASIVAPSICSRRCSPKGPLVIDGRPWPCSATSSPRAPRATGRWNGRRAARIDLCDPALRRATSGRIPDPHRQPSHAVTVHRRGTVAVLQLRAGRDGPMLLCHATGFHGRVWGPLADHLTGTVAFAPDLRGHGDTSPPTGLGIEWDGFADDMLAVVDTMASADRGRWSRRATPRAARRSCWPSSAVPARSSALYLLRASRHPAQVRCRPGPATGQPARRGRPATPRRRSPPSTRPYENFAAKPPLRALCDPTRCGPTSTHGFRRRSRRHGHASSAGPSVEAEVYAMGATPRRLRAPGRGRCPVTIAARRAPSVRPAAFAGRSSTPSPTAGWSSTPTSATSARSRTPTPRHRWSGHPRRLIRCKRVTAPA